MNFPSKRSYSRTTARYIIQIDINESTGSCTKISIHTFFVNRGAVFA